MSSLTNYGENALLEHLVRETTYTPAATLYLALCTGDPGEAATGASCNECTNVGNSYARATITFAAAASRAIANTGTVSFTALTGAAGTATHFAVCDSGTYGAGNVLAYGQFAASKSLVSGNTPTVAAGEVSISWAAATLSNYAANGLLDRMFRNQAFTVSANALGLATATISDSTTGINVTEVANSNGYARLALNAAGGAQPSWLTAGTSNVAANANQWSMPTPSGSWGTVVASFIADSASHASGNILMYDNGITDQAVGTDDVVYYATGQFSVTMT
jgi:hypothetical protein